MCVTLRSDQAASTLFIQSLAAAMHSIEREALAVFSYQVAMQQNGLKRLTERSTRLPIRFVSRRLRASAPSSNLPSSPPLWPDAGISVSRPHASQARRKDQRGKP